MRKAPKPPTKDYRTLGLPVRKGSEPVNGFDMPENRITAWFLSRMRYKFRLKREKDSKKGIDLWPYYLALRQTNLVLFGRLYEELGELMEAVRLGGDIPLPEQRYAIIDECADVANFAALIAWRYRSYLGGDIEWHIPVSGRNAVVACGNSYGVWSCDREEGHSGSHHCQAYPVDWPNMEEAAAEAASKARVVEGRYSE